MDKTIFETVEEAAALLRLDLNSEEFALYAEENTLAEDAVSAIADMLTYLGKKKQQAVVEMLLRTSRLPKKNPKTFENFDFSLLKRHIWHRRLDMPVVYME